jgi:hypothetical protein
MSRKKMANYLQVELEHRRVSIDDLLRCKCKMPTRKCSFEMDLTVEIDSDGIDPEEDIETCREFDFVMYPERVLIPRQFHALSRQSNR